MQIRPAGINDIPQLLRIEARCFTSDRIPARQLRYLIQRDSAQVIVATKNGEILGDAIILFRKNSKIARLYSIATDPDFQQQGIGRAVCNFVENESLRRGCSQIILEVRKDQLSSIDFYRHHDYSIFGEYKHFYEDGEDAWRMKKKLPVIVPSLHAALAEVNSS